MDIVYNMNKKSRWVSPVEYLGGALLLSIAISTVWASKSANNPTLEQQVQESAVAPADATLIDTPKNYPLPIDSNYLKVDSDYVPQ